MSLPFATSARKAADAERRERILDAAERAFADHGFHAATMQHVAEAAAMSAGNLYRTFPSKEALFEGMCERDQQQRMDAFAKLATHTDLFAVVAEGLREHIAQHSRRKAGLMVEIWSEAPRNPAIAAITRAIDEDILAKLEHVVALAKGRGDAAPTVDPAAVAQIFFTYVCGVLKRMAIEPELDAEAEAARAAEFFKLMCKGAFAPMGTESSR